MPPVIDEIHLRDYFDVILRRKWIVIIFMLVTFFSVAYSTFSTTPLFKSTGVLNASPTSISVDLSDDRNERFLTSRSYFETQIKLLKSDKLIGKTIVALNLENNKLFQGQHGNTDERSSYGIRSRIKDMLSYLKDTIKDMVRPHAEAELEPEVSRAMTDYILKEKTLKKIKNNLDVKAIKNTQLIEVSFVSPSATLCAEVANEHMSQFFKMLFENKVERSRSAIDFLQKQIESAANDLEESEAELNSFARSSGIVSMDSKLNPILSQLEEVNNALAEAVTDRITKESLYQQSIVDGGKFLSQVLNSNVIQNLKVQHANLMAQYQDMSTTFKPGYPKMKQLKARMNDLEMQYEQEINRVTHSIKNEFEVALKKENHLRKEAAVQKKLAMNLNETSSRYEILQREVETNKEIYKNLLTRSKEIEASSGSGFGNIEIADSARISLSPYTPKTFRNLLLGIFMGLFGGVGVAFLLEYMDKTIKDPSEFVNRYQIPVLGLVPLDKEYRNDDVSVAFKALNDPKAHLAEAIRTAMVSIKLSRAQHNLKTIMVTSVLPDAGKSTIATNLAISMLLDSSTVLIIDTDMRKPTLHRFFKHADNAVGLSSFLSGTGKVQDIILKSGIENLYFIPSGPLPINPAELIASSRMSSFLKSMAGKFDHIVIDTPPFHGFAEILILANMVDGVILISELNKTPRDDLQYFRQAVTNVGGNILGTMINKVVSKGGYGYGGYGAYGGSYGYGRE